MDPHPAFVRGFEALRFAHVTYLERFIFLNRLVKRREIWLEPFRARPQEGADLLFVLLRAGRPTDNDATADRGRCKLPLENNLSLQRLAIIDSFVALVGRAHASGCRFLDRFIRDGGPAQLRAIVFPGSLGANSIQALLVPFSTIAVFLSVRRTGVSGHNFAHRLADLAGIAFRTTNYSLSHSPEDELLCPRIHEIKD